MGCRNLLRRASLYHKKGKSGRDRSCPKTRKGMLKILDVPPKKVTSRDTSPKRDRWRCAFAGHFASDDICD